MPQGSPTGAGARPPLPPPHSPASCSPRPRVLLLGERDQSLQLSSTGSEEDEFHIVERLWRIQGKKLVYITYTEKMEDADLVFHSFSTHSFWTWRLSHSPEIPFVGIVVGAWFFFDSFD